MDYSFAGDNLENFIYVKLGYIDPPFHGFSIRVREHNLLDRGNTFVGGSDDLSFIFNYLWLNEEFRIKTSTGNELLHCGEIPVSS